MYIDCHVHLRDWDWKHKETIEHGLIVAKASGLDAVFDMPNTQPIITTADLVERRQEHWMTKENLNIFQEFQV